MPAFSVRVDPLNWLLLGRLGLELEVELLDWLTIESVPIFVTNDEPVLFGEGLRQESNGLGPIAGASIGAGFWLGGNSFNGTVLRVGFNNYAYRYSSHYELPSGTEDVDAANRTEQRLSFLIGSLRTWNWFTIAGAFGLEYETNQQTRCFPDASANPVSGGCDEFLLRTTPPGGSAEFVDANSGLHPYSFAFRLSLGVVID